MLCYDGTIDSTDFHGANIANWVGDGTAYQMQVNASATKANLQSTLTTISNRMNADSLLFVHTNNHGSPSGLCVDNSAVVTPAEWSTMLDGMKSFGTLVVTMEQCYSGAFLQPTLDHSKASRTSFASAVPADKVSAGASHFDQWAQTWFEAVNGATAYGASLAHNPDTNAERPGQRQGGLQLLGHLRVRQLLRRPAVRRHAGRLRDADLPDEGADARRHHSRASSAGTSWSTATSSGTRSRIRRRTGR